MPPTYSGSASRTVTAIPSLASTYAAVKPAGPAPITPTVLRVVMASTRSSSGEDRCHSVFVGQGEPAIAAEQLRQGPVPRRDHGAGADEIRITIPAPVAGPG